MKERNPLLMYFVCLNLATFLVLAHVVRAMPSAVNADAASVAGFVKFRSRFKIASFKKFNANKALKQSSVNLVQNLINEDKLKIEIKASRSDVHNPVQLYNTRKGRLFATVNLYNAVIKANVKPVGPKNTIGCPLNSEYTKPDAPHDNMNSITPIVPPVISDVRPPKATAGAKHVKYKNSVADIDFLVMPSIQSLL